MKRKKRIVYKGSIPKENYPFPLMSKGERKNRCMETERKKTCMETGGAMVIGGVMITGGERVLPYHQCCDQCQRGIFFKHWLSLIPTLGEVQ
jgi:hypothetical protein